MYLPGMTTTVDMATYVELSACSIYDTLNPIFSMSYSTNQLQRFTFNAQVEYHDQVINSTHKVEEIKVMIENFNLFELRDLLIRCSAVAVIIPEDNGITKVNTIEKIKMAINIITETIQLYASETIQNERRLSNRCANIAIAYDKLENENRALSEINSALEKKCASLSQIQTQTQTETI